MLLESILNTLPFGHLRKEHQSYGYNGILKKGSWLFRYDKTQIEHWRSIADKQRSLMERDPQAFQKQLVSQSPDEQYALLELLSQPQFGIPRNGLTAAQLSSKDIGGLYTHLIQHHFRFQERLLEEDAEVVERRQEFSDEIWRLAIPQPAIMFTVLQMTPDMLRKPYTEDVIPYMQQVVNRMGEEARKNAGDQVFAQLENLGVAVRKEEPVSFMREVNGDLPFRDQS